MPKASALERVAYSPGEFATLFGKSQTWGYRQIYAGKVNAITQHGRILIPAKEVERVLESAGIYNGQEKPKQANARIEKLTPEQKSIWHRFIERRQESLAQGGKTASKKGIKAHALPETTANPGKSGRGRIAQLWANKSTEH